MVEFKEHDCTSAPEFLDVLRLSNNKWWPYQSREIPDPEWQRDWIFRGQSSSKWSLIPAAWRRTLEGDVETPLERLKKSLRENLDFNEFFNVKFGNKRFFSPYSQEEFPEEEQDRKKILTFEALVQGFSEILLVNEFSDLADELGFSGFGTHNQGNSRDYISSLFNLYWPDGNTRIKNFQAGISEEQERFNFWTQLQFALAQHHGIPTRLLDWTRNPITAAFFAAAYVTNTNSDDKIVVYALHKAMLKEHIRHVEVSSSSNDFLRAQSGLFTVDLNDEFFLLENGKYPSLEESVKYLKRNYNPHNYPQKLTLPVSEVSALLRLLWLERVTHAHLMPTLDHVAEAVRLKVLLSENYDIMER